MDLNFRNVNFLPYWPTLSCRKNIGPLEVNLTAMEVAMSNGAKRMSPKRLPAISIDLFRMREVFFRWISRVRSGYNVESA